MSVGFEHPLPTLNIDFNWETVSENGAPARFHKRPFSEVANVTPVPFGPQIYRWILANSSGKDSKVYIGQSKNMKARLEGYRNGMPSRAKDQLNRIRERFEDTEAAGGTIELQLLRFARFSLNGIDISQESLSYAPLRHILENLAIFQAHREGMVLLNRNCEEGWTNVKLV